MFSLVNRPPVPLSRWLARQAVTRRLATAATVILALLVVVTIASSGNDLAAQLDGATGRVTQVLPAGELQVQLTGRDEPVRIALLGVDIPESWQAESAAWLKRELLSRNVRITFHRLPDREPAEPIRMYIYRDDGVLINEQIITEGYGRWAWNQVHTLSPWLKRVAGWSKRQGRGLWPTPSE